VELTGTKIRIQYDRDDIRTLKAFTSTGDYIGDLRCSKSWRRFAHSIKTRKLINKHVSSNAFAMRDPFTGYFNHLLKNKNTPTLALELIRVYRECSPNRSEFSFEDSRMNGDNGSDSKNNPKNKKKGKTKTNDVDDEEFPQWDPDV